MNKKTQRLFTHAYILGGSPCCGKSTIAEMLVARFNLQYYKVDDYEYAHLERSQPDQHPTMFMYSQMGWNEIWSRPVAQQVQDVFAYYRERFVMIVEDLSAYDLEQPIILEGAAYLPELIHECGVSPALAFFMAPAKAFQLHHYRQRPWIHDILRECDDPEQAFTNWMQRDHLFGKEVIRQAEALGYATTFVDGNRRIEGQYACVAAHFGLSAQPDHMRLTNV